MGGVGEKVGGGQFLGGGDWGFGSRGGDWRRR